MKCDYELKFRPSRKCGTEAVYFFIAIDNSLVKRCDEHINYKIGKQISKEEAKTWEIINK